MIGIKLRVENIVEVKAPMIKMTRTEREDQESILREAVNQEVTPTSLILNQETIKRDLPLHHRNHRELIPIQAAQVQQTDKNNQMEIIR